MNKILRLSLIALLAVFCKTTFAEDIIWSEDFSSYEKDAVPSGGANNYACVGDGTKIYNEKLAGGTAPELLIGKNGGSFSAEITLNGKSGDMMLSFNSNKDYLKVTISDADIKVGTRTRSGNTDLYPINVPAGKTKFTITFSNTSKNARFDDVKLYQGSAKKPAGLSWGTASREVTIGAADNKFPTLTNDNSLQVEYSSSDENVAVISSTGEIELKSAGKTTITAKFAGNDEYEAGEVSYTLTVKAASTVDISNTPETAYTVAKAIELITAGEGLEKNVYVKGIIASIEEVSTNYGNATYIIKDNATDENGIKVFRGKFLGGENFTSADQIHENDVVVVYGKLTYYTSKNENQIGSSNIYSINGLTTAISNIKAEAINENAPIYNLAGQRVNKTAKGILIQNGKKFVNK